MTEPSTPLMRQYAAVKKEHPTALLFFRLGDFYELFFDDAIVASKELQITLTSRNKEKGIAVPMCGVPHHAAEGYIGKLIRKGFKVAICEQVEDPRLAKKLVRREVTRVVTPGTAADSSLGSDENNFLAALAQVGDRVGFAALDLSTGEFRATEFSGENALRRVQEELEQLRPRELLYGSAAKARSGGRKAAPKRRWRTGFSRPIIPFRSWKIISEFCRSKDLDCLDERQRPLPPGRFCTTYARPSAGPSITWTASGGMNGRIAWCWTRSRCGILS
jgi:DNA mismatch repair protein MutS